VGRQFGVQASYINTETDYNSTQGSAHDQDSHRCGRASSRVNSARKAFSTPGSTFSEFPCEGKTILMLQSQCGVRTR